MKKSIVLIASVVLLLAGFTAPAFGEVRIATIDLRKVFDSYWKTKEADGSLKDRAAELDKEFKGLTDDYQKAKDDYVRLQAQAGDAAVATDEREKRKKAADAKLLEIRESEQTIESFRRQAAATLDEQKRRMRDKILVEIKTAVNAKAKSGGYTMVLDTAAESLNSTPVAVYTNGENDITDDILSQLNATAPASTTKSTDKAADKSSDKTGDKSDDSK